MNFYQVKISTEKLLDKAATTKRFEYKPLGGELKNQTIFTDKQYHELKKAYEFDEKKVVVI